jgi:hypothetical protein
MASWKNQIMARSSTAKSSRKMPVSEVQALVDSERSDSLSSFQASTLQIARAKALDYYNGDMSGDMPALPDRSTAVSTDVRDTIEGLMPSLMEIFASGDEVVKFNPVGPEDEEAAEQETDYINHVFLHQSRGWFVLYNYIKDALLSKVGIVKVWWGEETEITRETYGFEPGTELTDEELGILLLDEALEVVEHSERPSPAAMSETPGTPFISGMPVEVAGGGNGASGFAPLPPPMLHTVIVEKKKKYGSLQVEPVPPEEFGIARKAKSINDAAYCFHETWQSKSDLIIQGFNKTQVNSLPESEASLDEESKSRDTVEESDNNSLNATSQVGKSIRVTEHYIRMDYEGDGIDRLYRVTTAGAQGEILKRGSTPDIAQVDEAPFAAMSPIIVTHRFFGMSVADMVLDIQRMKTALTRAMLDNIYLSNNQRLEVAEEGATRNTIDDVLDNKPGGIVRTKRVGSIVPIPNSPIGDFVMPMVQYLDATREWRTGVTRQGQGIEANALQNQTAEAVGKVFTAAQARMRLMARVFAETGIRDLFSLVHTTIRKNDDKASTVRLRNRWVDINPRVWGHRKDMTISVGMGSGSRDQQMQFLMAILNIQKEAISSPELGLVDPSQIFNTLKKAIDYAGLGHAESFFTDPTGKEPTEPPPDPETEKARMEMQLEQEKAKADAQLEQQKAQAEMQLAKEKAAAEMQLARERMAAEQQLARERLHLEMGLNREGNVMKARNDRDVKLTANRPGGSLAL